MAFYLIMLQSCELPHRKAPPGDRR